MVSNYMEFNEKFQNDRNLSTTNALLFERQLEQLLARVHEASINEQDPSPVATTLNPVSSCVRPPISRRHSSSTYGSQSARQSHLSKLVETKNLINAMIGLETLTEERINRGRAFSESAALFSLETEQQQPPQSTTSRYKTELCRPFEEHGKCKYGEKCQFAHGKHELRHMVRHPKYKTELCRTYHTTGLCPYGPRCHFIHNQDEVAVDAQRQSVALKHTSPLVAQISQAQRRNKPGSLQLSAQQQRGVGRLNSASFSPPHVSSPLEAQSPFISNDAVQFQPPSPLGKNCFNLPVPMSPRELQLNAGLDAPRGGSPPLFMSGGLYQDASFDDGVFEQSSSDSERESSNGSPPGFNVVHPPSASTGQQRLPIFRCLSQS